MAKIDDKTLEKIVEAHELGYSQREAAEYAKTSQPTVNKYWKILGLKPNNDAGGQRQLTEKQLEMIIEAHHMGYSTTQAAIYANTSPRTIRKYWKDKGLEAHNPRAPVLTSEQIEKITAAHGMGHSMAEAAAYSNTSERTVQKYWRLNNLDPNYKKAKDLTKKQKRRIAKAHQLGFSISQTAVYAQTSQMSVRIYWREFGLKPHYKKGGQSNMTEEKIDRIIEAHQLGYSTIQAAEYAQTNSSTVRKYWRMNGLKPHNKKPPEMTENQIRKILEAHELGYSLSRAAKHAGTTQTTVHIRWKKEGLTPNNKKPQKLTEEQIEKIYEAHQLGHSLRQAAEHARTNDRTIQKYWRKKELEPHYKDMNEFWYHFGNGEICFDSQSERIVGILLNLYGLIGSYKEESNIHVRVSGNNLDSIDFLVGEVFIEYHPLSIRDKKKGLTLEETGQRKQKSITNPEHQGFSFYHIWKIEQLYDVLQKPEINTLLPEEVRNLSKEQFDEDVQVACMMCALYDGLREDYKARKEDEKFAA
ncbi:hypothetical protein KY359_04520 [Candidatus Woesearchaeota archaeon]|nr:hypothetical protein [Candidatus Woesearchaeota archaeon]